MKRTIATSPNTALRVQQGTLSIYTKGYRSYTEISTKKEACHEEEDMQTISDRYWIGSLLISCCPRGMCESWDTRYVPEQY